MLNLNVTGPQGAQGTQGSQGTQGTQGTQGLQGAFGGAQGAQGSQGSQGTSGSQGNQGYQGATGASGSNGSTATFIESVADSNVKLLLHMNGVDNSTTFTDHSTSSLSPTVYGNAKISTSASKFGSSSAYFDGSGDYLLYNPSSVFNLNSKDFTIEGWVNLSSAPSNDTIISTHNSAAGGVDYILTIQNSTTLWFWIGGSPVTITIPTISTGTWYHFAVVRSSGSISVYWDGTQVGSSLVRNPTYSSLYVSIGCDRYDSPQWFFHGYMDEIRISHVARYTSNFTPSTTAFPDEFNNLPGDAAVGQIIFSGSGIYICSSTSPLTWKKFSSSPITLTG